MKPCLPILLVATITARKAPYARPARLDCTALAHAVHDLDKALGPDVDAPKGADKSLIEQSSGAERESWRVTSAIAAGSARRAFLKGWMSMQGGSWNVLPFPPDP